MIVGLRSIIQKENASSAGKSNIINIVSRGLTLSARSEAYESEPITPAPPVPDDHVDTTFL